jgi:alginate O-acetyltransferase complex protein AlgI
MVFSDIVFLFMFLPAVLLLYYISPAKLKNPVLLLMSLIFYGWGEPVYILLMLISIVMNYLFGIWIDKAGKKYKGAGREENGNAAGNNEKESSFTEVKSRSIISRMNAALITACVFNIGLLFVFKYLDFAIGTVNDLSGSDLKLCHMALPIGISFYTFQAMSYVIDLYRYSRYQVRVKAGMIEDNGKDTPDKVSANYNILDFGLYITMFPQLIAGPIVKYKDIACELKNRKETVEDFESGIMRFACGLAKKVLIANNIGKVWSEISAYQAADLSASTAWLGVLAFTFQIYFDFSGYSDMAIGLGRMFGFHFNENFNYPYISKSITEFWRRWHISLSAWFREYVYFPLGGSRKGALRQIFNLFAVWSLTGLWHGASWNFVLWGLYYCVLLIIEKFVLKNVLTHIPGSIRMLFTFVLVTIGWALFSFADVPAEGRHAFLNALLFKAPLGIISKNTAYILLNNAAVFIIALIGSGELPRKIGSYIERKCYPAKGLLRTLTAACMIIISVVYVVSDTYNPFLYFRF